VKQQDLERIMNETQDAYMRKYFTEESWQKSVENLFTAGYTVKAILEIMRSLYMRWAYEDFAKKVETPDNEDDFILVADGSEIMKYVAKTYHFPWCSKRQKYQEFLETFEQIW